MGISNLTLSLVKERRARYDRAYVLKVYGDEFIKKLNVLDFRCGDFYVVIGRSFNHLSSCGAINLKYDKRVRV